MGGGDFTFTFILFKALSGQFHRLLLIQATHYFRHPHPQWAGYSTRPCFLSFHHIVQFWMSTYIREKRSLNLQRDNNQLLEQNKYMHVYSTLIRFYLIWIQRRLINHLDRFQLALFGLEFGCTGCTVVLSTWNIIWKIGCQINFQKYFSSPIVAVITWTCYKTHWISVSYNGHFFCSFLYGWDLPTSDTFDSFLSLRGALYYLYTLQ